MAAYNLSGRGLQSWYLCTNFEMQSTFRIKERQDSWMNRRRDLTAGRAPIYTLPGGFSTWVGFDGMSIFFAFAL